MHAHHAVLALGIKSSLAWLPARRRIALSVLLLERLPFDLLIVHLVVNPFLAWHNLVHIVEKFVEPFLLLLTFLFLIGSQVLYIAANEHHEHKLYKCNQACKHGIRVQLR